MNPSEMAVEPTPTAMIQELRDRLHLSNHAHPDSPRDVWAETLEEVSALMSEHCKSDEVVSSVFPTDAQVEAAARAHLADQGYYVELSVEPNENDLRKMRAALEAAHNTGKDEG